MKIVMHCVRRVFLFLFEEKVSAGGTIIMIYVSIFRRLMTEKVI